MLLACAGHAAAGEQYRHIEAEYLRDASPAPPPAGAAWRKVALPDRWNPAVTRESGPAWYRIRFSVDGPAEQPWLVYLARFRDGGQLFLDGALLASVRTSDAAARVRWMRPHAFSILLAQIPPGSHELHVRVPGPSADQPMASVVIGPESEIRPLYEWRQFWVITTAQITAVFMAAVGLFVIAIWLHRRMEILYGLFGLAALLWSIRTLSFVIEVYPAPLWDWWRVVHYAATGGFIAFLTRFMQRFAGLHWPRTERIYLAYALLGPVALAVGGPGWHDAIDRYWQAGLLVIGVLVLGVTFYAGWRQRTASALALCAAMLVTIACGVHDYFLSQGWFGYERIYLLHFGADVLLLTMGALLAVRFGHSLDEVATANVKLEQKVAEKERELTQNYDRLRAFERNEAASDERQRIVQDMHDGLGSKLLVSLAMVERGALDRPGIAQALRESIDDMRLAIDTLSPGESGLLTSLGNLRYRIEPRLKALGMETAWRSHGLDPGPEVPPHDSLQILRMVQESITNVLKHAGATRLEVDVEVLREAGAARLIVTIADNGAGFDPARTSSGRGLVNMQSRGARIGARVTIQSGADGTRVRVDYPLPAA